MQDEGLDSRRKLIRHRGGMETFPAAVRVERKAAPMRCQFVCPVFGEKGKKPALVANGKPLHAL